MSLNRWDARRDANEPAIIRQLETLGFHVERCDGTGLPDLILSRAGAWYVAECKMPHGRLRKSQTMFRQQARAPIPIFRELDDVLAWERGLPR